MDIEFVFAVPPGTDGMALARIDALARGKVRAQAAPEDLESFWFEHFGVARQADWPVAPLRLGAAPAGDAYWLCADPIYLQLDGDRLLFDPADADIDAAQSAHLIAALNAQLQGEGMELRAVTPARWVLRMPRALAVATPSPMEAAGMPAMAVLPTGADAGAVRRLSSEMQMLLHQAAAQDPRAGAINSLWLWGGGNWPAPGVVPAPQGEIVLSPQAHVRELCELAGGQGMGLPSSWNEAWLLLGPVQCHKVLIDLTEIIWKADWPGDLQTNWLEPAALAARKQKLTFSARITTPGESLHVRLYRRDLFHFFGWKSLAQYIDKSQNLRHT
ncbi:MAG TPA: hypothetical protein VGN52_00965 [Burkholderiales bacterium]